MTRIGKRRVYEAGTIAFSFAAKCDAGNPYLLTSFQPTGHISFYLLANPNVTPFDQAFHA
jgi:hypothetical protein